MHNPRDIEILRRDIACALETAKQAGASQAEAFASAGAGLSATVRMRDVETLEYHRDQGLSVTVYFGHRKGSASTSDMTEEVIAETVRKACALARYAAEDECAGLADAGLMADRIPDLSLDHPWALEPPAAIELALACEAAALDTDARITNSEGATVSSHAGARAYGNSHGFLEGYRSTQHSVSCAVIAAAGGQMERDFEYTVARNADALLSPELVGREAATRAVGRLGGRKLATSKVPVLYPARLARSLFGHLLGAISGGSLYRKSTFLVDHLGKQVFADFVDLHERPHLPEGLASAPFDDEGVATVERQLVAGGVLQGYLLSSYYGRKLGMPSTGNAGGAHNIVVPGSGQDFKALLTELDTGLLLTELMGHGINLVTGDYSRGAAGFWVEKGEIAYPVNEITVAGNLAQMYRQIRVIGSDVDERGSIRTGSVLVDGMTVAGS